MKANCVDSNTLSPVIFTLYGADDGTIVDGGSGFPNDYCFDGVKTIGNKLYFYLPTGTKPTFVICGEITYTSMGWDREGIFINKEDIEENPFINLCNGEVTFSVVGEVLSYTIGDETKFYSGTATITDGEGTTNAIKVIDGEHNIVIDNVLIVPESTSPISILNSAKANITLVGENILTGGSSDEAYAGICVSEGASLVIDGTGSLTATGGML